ncbi:SDR family oxidoreductase [Cellulosimicrobium sp. XJ-DQ-B-000]|uniref:SDR family NAD(P)-dependent oxidoreductase n=1 Tax=Cellulosimicrobium sp. XJ-DQ-B-000 TaxID=3072182 RepID=UPI002807F12B|nr:SDR family oxidoreductase [Cellulosimicrobium sp. XJ-DQ-B-000]MDQ8041416.1 SDR family oxidoreductase [Cellulosimicrobium sp. XJ-DQ-B-000]
MSPRSLVVTGAASGIGRAVAVGAARDGWFVHVLDLDPDGAAATVDLARQAGGDGRAHVLDVTDAAAVAAAVGTAAESGPPLRGLFAGAGIDVGGAAHELDPATWRRVLDVNVTGTFLVVREVLRAMIDGDGGSVVLCGSPAATVGFAAGGATAYGASKGAISSMVRTLAVDYARHGVRVNAIVPGPTETPLMWANVPADEIAATRAQIEHEVPLGRLARPEEIAEPVLWLLSDRSSYTTGSLVGCDGGVLAKSSISV